MVCAPGPFAFSVDGEEEPHAERTSEAQTAPPMAARGGAEALPIVACLPALIALETGDLPAVTLPSHAMPIGSILGRAVRRSEDPRFLTGAVQYSEDVPAEGALHAVFVRSFVAHARVG